jgi:hypothetical protein
MKYLLTAALVLMITVAACKKENIITYSSNTQVIGVWTGKYSAGGSQNINWTATLKTDGSCSVYEAKITDTLVSSRLDGVYNISEGKLKLYARTAGSFEVKYDAALNNNALDGTIVWMGISNGTPFSSAGIGNLVKQ